MWTTHKYSILLSSTASATYSSATTLALSKCQVPLPPLSASCITPWHPKVIICLGWLRGFAWRSQVTPTSSAPMIVRSLSDSNGEWLPSISAMAHYLSPKWRDLHWSWLQTWSWAYCLPNRFQFPKSQFQTLGQQVLTRVVSRTWL